MFRAIVIYGQPLFRAAIKVILNQNEFTLVAEADNGVDGLELVRTHRPDLLIMDGNMPKNNGWEVIEKVYGFDKSIEVLMLTSNSASHYDNRCRAARVPTFLSKTCSVEELGRTINILMAERAPLFNSVARLPNINSSYANETLLIQSLSNRELMTFELLAKGMSNKEIADYLQLSSKTISTYKTRLLGKLNVFSLIQLLEMAKRNGLVS